MNWKTWMIVLGLLAAAVVLSWSSRNIGVVDGRATRNARVHQMCVDVLMDLRSQKIAPEVLEPEFEKYCPELLVPVDSGKAMESEDGPIVCKSNETPLEVVVSERSHVWICNENDVVP
jgi:hypothetical protein